MRTAQRTLLRTTLGVVIGLAGATATLSWLDAHRSVWETSGAILSDCDGALDRLVIHYVPEAADAVIATYRDFLGCLPKEVTVYVVCPDIAAMDDLVNRIGPTACRLESVPVGHAITPWSRDRWLALHFEEPDDRTTLLTPRGEHGEQVWPARAGDGQVASDLAATLGPAIEHVGGDLDFDGGDFVADRETVFVTPAVLARNLQQTVARMASRAANRLTRRSARASCRNVHDDCRQSHRAGW